MVDGTPREVATVLFFLFFHAINDDLRKELLETLDVASGCDLFDEC